jgi:hypothetical protein
MDETGFEILLGVLGIVAAVVITTAWWWRRSQQKAEIAQTWPETAATIESGRLEPVKQSRASLPTFAFSYHVNGEYYSGRFGLIPGDTSSEALIQRLVGRKLQIRFNPEQPEVWFLAEERIEGCKVEQELDPHLIDLSPRD